MLPKEFLEVRKYKGKIFPKFLKIEDIEVAELVLGVYKSNQAKKLKFAKKELRQMENSKNYKKLRGLARIVENSTKFIPSSPLSPSQVRKFLFSRGFVTTRAERQKIIEEAAEKFGTTVESIENSIFADLEEEALIDEIEIASSEDLLRKYNLSLLQTTIFNSLRLTFWTESEHKRIFWAVKRLGLMYDIDEGITLTGPASILKQTRRYGTSFAKIVPLIVSSPSWWIKAEILDDYSNKVYRLEISSDKKIPFPEIYPQIEFDSSLEEEFYFRLKASRPDIEILREPEIIKSGDYAFIPDFKLRKGDKEVYVEIAGFWTEEYLRKKIEKVKNLEIPLIILGSEELKVASEFFIPLKRKLPFLKILKLVNRCFAREKEDKEVEKEKLLKELEKKKAINLKKLRFNNKELSELLASSGLLKIEDWLFHPSYVDELKEKLSKGEVSTLAKGTDVLLDYLGYKIIWEGISDFRIVKK